MTALTISGTVTAVVNSNRQGLSNASVLILDTDRNLLASTASDDNGDYTISVDLQADANNQVACFDLYQKDGFHTVYRFITATVAQVEVDVDMITW